MAAMNRFFKASALYGGIAAALSAFFSVSQPVQAAPEPVQTEVGAIIQGRLEESDSRLSAGQYADAYTFIGTAGEEVLLNLASSDFDGFLWLLNSAGEVIAIDDDTGDALSALISKFTLPGNDTYTVHVSSYQADEIGDYSLTFNEVPQIDYAEPLVLGDRIRGRLGYEDAQFSTGQFFDAYTFEAQHGQAVSITMRSRRIDTYLWLLDQKGRVMTVNDDRKGGKKKRPVSQIIFFPPVSGTYTILASAKEPELEGGYQLLLNTTARPIRAERLAGTVSGELSAADFQLSTGQYLDVYAFDGEKGESVSLGLSSSGFDSYLRILDSDGNVVQHDDDSGGGKDALIQGFLLPETGRYFVWVSSVFGGSKSEYVLSLNDSAMEMRSLSMDTVAEADTKEGLNITLRNKSDSVVSGGMSGGFELTAAQVDKPFTNPDRCKGSTSSYPAKVEICIGDRDEALSGTVSVSGPSGIVISPGSMSFTVSPNSCVTKSTFSITSASASAGVKSITATVSGLGSDSEELNVVGVDVQGPAYVCPSVTYSYAAVTTPSGYSITWSGDVSVVGNLTVPAGTLDGVNFAVVATTTGSCSCSDIKIVSASDGRPHSLSETEACLAYPIDCLTIDGLADEAANWAAANETALGGGISRGCADAARHAYFNAIATLDINASTTQLFADAHEYSNFVDCNDNNMDLSNNEVGRGIGDGCTTRSCIKNAVVQALREGHLIVTNPPVSGGTLVPSSICTVTL